MGQVMSSIQIQSHFHLYVFDIYMISLPVVCVSTNYQFEAMGYLSSYWNSEIYIQIKIESTQTQVVTTV